jgi:hypothetical protein
VPRADSTVRVNIIGDAKSLAKAADKSEQAVGGIGKQAKIAGGIIAGAFAVDQVLDFGQTALDEADRVGDAAGRLESQFGDLSVQLKDTADEFAFLGASDGDMLELEARIADIGTAAGISKGELAGMADDASSTAAALALITDTDADTWIDAIGKAAGGSERPLKDLGINLTDAEVAARAMADTGKDTADALTDGELAAARLELILEKLAPRIQEVTDGNADLEQKQAEVQAKWETLTGKIGEGLEGPLSDLLSFIITGIEGWELFAHWMGENEQAFRDILGPIARVNDALSALLGIIGDVLEGLGKIGEGPDFSPRNGRGPQSRASGQLSGAPGGGGTTINVQGGSPEVIEQAVRRAINSTARRG